MKRKARDIVVELDYRSGIERAILFTDYRSGSLLFGRVMYEFVLALFESVAPLDEKRKRTLERRFKMRTDDSGPTSFSFRVSGEEAESLPGCFLSGERRYVRILPERGGWEEISYEEYCRDEGVCAKKRASSFPGQPGMVTEGTVHVG